MLWETFYQGYFELIFNEGSRSRNNRNVWIKNSERMVSHKKDGIWPWDGKGFVFSGHKQRDSTKSLLFARAWDKGAEGHQTKHKLGGNGFF